MTILDIKDLELISDNKIKQDYKLPVWLKLYMYNNEIYIVKGNRMDRFSSFNELFCAFLAPTFNIVNAEYVFINDNDKYMLASRNFKDENYEYYDHLTCDVLNIGLTKFNNYFSIDRIKAYKKFFSTNEKYNEFIESILNLFAFDFYNHQEDRNIGNIALMSKKDLGPFDFSLAPIYDNECSFNYVYRKETQICNEFYHGNISNRKFINLLNKYPNSLKIFKSILDINIDKKLNLFKIECSNAPICHDKKEIIKELDEESKKLVLKYL